MNNQIVFEPKYRIGQRVYTVDIWTDGWYHVSEKCKIVAYVYNGDDIFYILGDEYHPYYNETWYNENDLYIKYSDAVAEKNRLNNSYKGGQING